MFADTHVKNCDNVQRQGKGRVRKRQDISSNIHDGAYTSSSVRSMVTRPCSRVHASFSLVFRGVSRRFLYRCVEFRVHVEEFIGDELCSPLTRACAITCIRLHACQSRFLSFSLFLSLAFPSPSFQDFSTDSAAYFFSFFLPLDFPPRPIAMRPLRVFRQRIKGYIRAGCLAHIARGTRVWSRRARAHTARKEKRKNSKSKAPWLVIHRRSAPAVRRHYLRVSRHSELLIRPDAGGKCAPTIQPAFLTAKIRFEVLTR